jgi:hypothetical protein
VKQIRQDNGSICPSAGKGHVHLQPQGRGRHKARLKITSPVMIKFQAAQHSAALI